MFLTPSATTRTLLRHIAGLLCCGPPAGVHDWVPCARGEALLSVRSTQGMVWVSSGVFWGSAPFGTSSEQKP